MTELVTHFSDACEFVGVTDSDREAWLEARRSMLTASDMAAILGEDPYRDAWDVYVEKTMPPGPDVPLDIGDPRFWGKVLEQPIAEAVCRYYGWEFHRGGALLRSRLHSWLGCTLDAEIFRDWTEGWLPWEGKTSRVPKGWDEDSGELPPRVLVQAQVQLVVTRAPRNIVFGLLQGSTPHQLPIEPDDEFHAIVIEEGERFMDLVKRGEPPTPTAKSRRAIERLYPDDDGTAVHLPIEAVEWTREVQELAAMIRELEDRKEAFRNRLRASIGHAAHGILAEPVGGKACWSWKRSKGAETRTLRELNRAPPNLSLLPAPAPLELGELIDLSPSRATTTPINRKRRRARR